MKAFVSFRVTSGVSPDGGQYSKTVIEEFDQTATVADIVRRILTAHPDFPDGTSRVLSDFTLVLQRKSQQIPHSRPSPQVAPPPQETFEDDPPF